MRRKLFATLLPLAAVLVFLFSPAGTARAEDAKTPSVVKCPHDASKELCFICDPTLREKGRLWCEEHNRYEDRCWECHPDAQGTNRAFCARHDLYEDECFLCKPDLKAESAFGAQAAADVPRLICKEHNVPEGECGICHPELVGKMEPGRGLKVRFPSAAAAAKAGIETAPPRIGPMADGIECYAELAFNQGKLAQIAVPIGGILRSVEVDLGDIVEQGRVLATVYSAAIGESVAKAVLTHQSVERERQLHAERVSPEKDLQEAEVAFRAARQQLKTLGFEDRQIEALVAQSVESAVLEIRAPFRGEVVERNAVRGALVEAGKALFTVADRSTMWAMLSIPENQLAHVRLGQPVELRVDALPDHTFTGRLTWIAAQVDDRTRMARARAEMPNLDAALRAQMFAKARILTRHSDKAVIVPQDAIQHMENTDFVFVKIADDLFEARAVRVGAKCDGSV